MSTPPPNSAKHCLYDEKQRKIILKDSLHTTPDPDDQIRSTQDSSWTKLGWQKAGSVSQPAKLGKGKKPWGNQKMQKLQPNKVQKRLEEALSKPVQLTKAESMMKKMGWQGGALGKEGTGIVEPVAPNAAYALKTLGFGQASHTPDPPPPKKVKAKLMRQKAQQLKQVQKAQSNLEKESFQINILQQILEFVMNDYAIEIVFDKHLFKNERKVVHRLVNDVINGDEMTSMECMDLVEKIREHNCYVLCTESQGVFPDRYLCLFKEPPEHVYLITPKDLRDKSEEDEEECEETEENSLNNETNKTHNINENINKEKKDPCNDISNKVIKSEENANTELKDIISSSDLTQSINFDENINKEIKDNEEMKEDMKDITMKDITDTHERVDVDSLNDLKETPNENVGTEVLPASSSNDLLKADVKTDGNTKEENINTDLDSKINKDIENQHVNVPEKLLEYLKEFAESEDYTEMRFLGAFSMEEMNSINNLVSNMYYHVNHNVDKVEKVYEEVFKEFDEERYIFEVKEDINGSPVIHKIDTYKGKRKSTKNHVYFDAEEFCEDAT